MPSIVQTIPSYQWQKARKKGRARGSNLDFLPVGCEAPPLLWVSQSQARRVKVILSEDYRGEEAVTAASAPPLILARSLDSNLPPGYTVECVKLSVMELLDAVQKTPKTEWKDYLHWLKKKKKKKSKSLSLFICPLASS